jgi:hypothetical protein
MLTGELRSKPFTIPVRRLIIPVVGLPNSQYAGIYLESELDHKRFGIGPGAAHIEWQPFAITLPGSLVGTVVRLVAYSRSKAVYIGVGTPYYRINESLPGVRFSTVFASTLAALSYVGLLFVPAVTLLRRWKTLPGVRRFLTCLVVVGLVSLLMFYLAYFAPALGRLCARGWLLISVGLLTYLVRSRTGLSRSEWTCLKLIACITAFQAFFVFSFNLVSTPYATNYLFFPAVWSTDNQIPPTLAKLLTNGTADTAWPFGQWKISDRPPLLAAMIYPAAVLLRDLLPSISSSTEAVIVQVSGFAIQNSWLLAVWTICSRVGMDRRKSVGTVLLLASTPFVFVNTIYISPKILGATLNIIQYLFLPRARGDTVSTQPRELGTWICGAAAGLAIMSHAAAGLPVLTIFAFGAFFQGKSAWRSLAVSGLVAAAVVIPWIVWTHYYSPNANALPRYLLTGDTGFGRPPVPLLDATLQLYRSMSFSTWLHKKMFDLATLGGWQLQDVRPWLLFGDVFGRYDSIRAYQSFFFLPCLGLLIVPLGWWLWKRGKLRPEDSPNAGVLQGLIWSSFACFAVQFVIMMSPHLIYHYPSFVPLALHIVAIVTVVTLRTLLLRLVALLNYFLFIVYWILLVAINTPVSSVLGLLCAFAFLFVCSLIIVRELFARGKAHQLVQSTESIRNADAS